MLTLCTKQYSLQIRNMDHPNSKRTPTNFIFWPNNISNPDTSLTRDILNQELIQTSLYFLSLDTSLFIVFSTEGSWRHQNFVIFELYRVKNEIIFEKIPNLDLMSSINSFTEISRKVYRRKNFKRTLLRVLYVVS